MLFSREKRAFCVILCIGRRWLMQAKTNPKLDSAQFFYQSSILSFESSNLTGSILIPALCWYKCSNLYACKFSTCGESLFMACNERTLKYGRYSITKRYWVSKLLFNRAQFWSGLLRVHFWALHFLDCRIFDCRIFRNQIKLNSFKRRFAKSWCLHLICKKGRFVQLCQLGKPKIGQGSILSFPLLTIMNDQL